MSSEGSSALPDVRGLHDILDQLDAAVYIKDRDGRYHYVNAAHCRALHRTVDAMLGRFDHEIFPAETAAALHQADQNIMQSGHSQLGDATPLNNSAMAISKQDIPGFFSMLKQPLRDARNQVQGILCMSLNIHSLAEKEQQLTALKNRYSAILKAMPGLIFEMDLEGNYLDLFSPRPDLLAAQPEKLLGHNIRDVLPAPAVQACLDALQEANKIDYSNGKQFELKLPSGLHWFELTVVRKENGHHAIPRFIMLSCDITDRKQADITLRQKESLLRAVIDNTPLAIWARDMDGVCIMENEALVKRWGSILGTRTEDSNVAPEDLKIWQAHNALAYAGEIVDKEVTFKGMGEPRTYQNIIAPIRIDDQIVGIVGHALDITERKETEQKIRNLAFFDPLTNLANRRLMFDRFTHALSSAKRRHRQGALLLIDLDNFKQVNDSAGHDAGDQLLQEVAHRLRAGIRQVDTAARLGGDEFVIILEDLDNDKTGIMQAERIALQLLQRLRQPYALGLTGGNRHFTHHCSGSIGIAMFEDDSTSCEELLRRADTAMYQSKMNGRDCVRFFDPQMQAVASIRTTLENDLRTACQKNQFVLYFQPLVDPRGNILGAEALLRWRHPTQGLILPEVFLAAAEETGLINGLGHWVLETACQQLVRWFSHPATEHLTLSVNISPRQFHQPSFSQELGQLLTSTTAPAQRLKLELTEALLLDHSDTVIKRIRELKALGIGFVLDDFGTGHSSLAYLQQLPLDQLKIDRTFVSDMHTNPGNAIIARTIAAMGNSLGLEVVAEGVETIEQQRLLADYGCHRYQGHLFGQPMEISQFEDALLNTESTAPAPTAESLSGITPTIAI